MERQSQVVQIPGVGRMVRSCQIDDQGLPHAIRYEWAPKPVGNGIPRSLFLAASFGWLLFAVESLRLIASAL